MASFPALPLDPPLVVTSEFGAHESFRKSPHKGVDFAAPVGAPLYAVDDGIVDLVGHNPSSPNGKFVRLLVGRFRVWYLHMSVVEVGKGERVDAGEQIGLSGNTGNTTGPHLHFEVEDLLRGGKEVDPLDMLQVPLVDLDGNTLGPKARAPQGGGILLAGVALMLLKRRSR